MSPFAFSAKCLLPCLGLAFVASTSLNAQAPVSRPKLASDDRFVRIVNLIEPRLTKSWRAGVNLSENKIVKSKDTRSRETTGYIAVKTSDLKKKWFLQATQFPASVVGISFAGSELQKSVFTTVFCFGTMTDSSQDISPTVVPDSVASLERALIRFVPAVRSYPVRALINDSPVQTAPGVITSVECPEGTLKATLFWTDQLHPRRQEYQFLIETGKAYTLAVIDSGEGAFNPTMIIFDDSALAKNAVVSLNN